MVSVESPTRFSVWGLSIPHSLVRRKLEPPNESIPRWSGLVFDERSQPFGRVVPLLAPGARGSGPTDASPLPGWRGARLPSSARSDQVQLGSDAELLCVLRVQSLPAAELHRVGTDDAADGRSAEKVIQNVEADVPPGGTHRDEAAIDVGPQGQARAAAKGLEFPPHVEATPFVLEHRGSVGSRHRCFGNVRRWGSYRGELHRRSNRTQAPIGVERCPLAQLRRFGERLPDFFRRVAQFSDENERPLLAVLSYLHPAGRTLSVLPAIGHFLLPEARRQAGRRSAYRPYATNTAKSPIPALQTSG